MLLSFFPKTIRKLVAPYNYDKNLAVKNCTQSRTTILPIFFAFRKLKMIEQNISESWQVKNNKNTHAFSIACAVCRAYFQSVQKTGNSNENLKHGVFHILFLGQSIHFNVEFQKVRNNISVFIIVFAFCYSFHHQ